MILKITKSYYQAGFGLMGPFRQEKKVEPNEIKEIKHILAHLYEFGS